MKENEIFENYFRKIFAKWNINSKEREKYRQLWFLIFSRYSDIICIQRGIHFQTKNNESDLERKENIDSQHLFRARDACACLRNLFLTGEKLRNARLKRKYCGKKKKKKVKCRTLKIKTIFSPLIFTQSSRINDKELRSVVSFVWKKKKKESTKNIYFFILQLLYGKKWR